MFRLILLLSSQKFVEKKMHTNGVGLNLLWIDNNFAEFTKTELVSKKIVASYVT